MLVLIGSNGLEGTLSFCCASLVGVFGLKGRHRTAQGEALGLKREYEKPTLKGWHRACSVVPVGRAS